MTQVTLGQAVHTVIVQARMHGIGHQHCVIKRGYINAVAGEYLGVVLHVLTDLQNGFIFQNRLQHCQGFIDTHLTFDQVI